MDLEKTLENSIEEAKKIKIIREEILKRFNEYNKIISVLCADAPISDLCLPKATEKCLLQNGLLRVYDLLDCDLTKIKGIGEVRVRDLTACLDKFVSML